MLEARSDAGGFAPARICVPGELQDCLLRETGIVDERAGFLDDIRIVYDDGRRRVGLSLRAAEGPPPGTRVWLERWDAADDDDVVAVYDRERERRYRTIDWPERWNPDGIGAGVFGATLLALLFWPKAARAVARRRNQFH